jgi:folate-binding protein YgfZ
MAPTTGIEHDQATAFLFDRGDRVRLEILGPDRAKFLHNLVTNEVKRLQSGRGCEAFVTSPQGKTIGYVTLHALDDRILVRTDPGGMALALPHLRKYGVFDDVEITDRTPDTFEIHIAGEAAEEIVTKAGARIPNPADLAHDQSEIGGVSVRIIRESPTGWPGLTIIGESTGAASVREFLESRADGYSLAFLSPAQYNLLRIEAGTPVFGIDITERNLPQEIDRDARAISFVKGCYLGQETVARLDALGHVNQVMKGFVLEAGSPVPAMSSVVEFGGKKAGVITSAAFSPDRASAIALGFVRTAQAEAGTVVSVVIEGAERAISATVADLPLRKPHRSFLAEGM